MDEDGKRPFPYSTVGALVGAYIGLESLKKKKKKDHRTLPRPTRREFDHVRAHTCIMDDYLKPDALFGADFKLQFRISLSMFQCIMETIMNSNIQFYKISPVAVVSSVEARLLLPLKTLAYGVPSHTFIDYFQMSKTFARTCCDEFDKAMLHCFKDEWLRFPDTSDLKSILKLQKHVHEVDGMFGSLDCTNTVWKNCPVAWHGVYKGKEKHPKIVLEGLCDHHTFLWHFS